MHLAWRVCRPPDNGDEMKQEVGELGLLGAMAT